MSDNDNHLVPMGQEAHQEPLQEPHADERTAMDQRLLQVLVCPVTRGPLVYDREAQELISKSAHYAYPVRDGIPILIIDEARRIED